MVRDDAGAKSDRDGKSPWEGVPLRPRALQVAFVRRFISLRTSLEGPPKNQGRSSNGSDFGKGQEGIRGRTTVDSVDDSGI
jgi:hypothetical protein